MSNNTKPTYYYSCPKHPYIQHAQPGNCTALVEMWYRCIDCGASHLDRSHYPYHKNCTGNGRITLDGMRHGAKLVLTARGPFTVNQLKPKHQRPIRRLARKELKRD